MLTDLINYFKKSNEEDALNYASEAFSLEVDYNDNYECLSLVDPPDYSDELEESYLRHLCSRPVFAFVESLREIEGCVDEINRVSSELLNGGMSSPCRTSFRDLGFSESRFLEALRGIKFLISQIEWLRTDVEDSLRE